MLENEKMLKFHFKNGDWVVVNCDLQKFQEITNEIKEEAKKTFIYFNDIVAVDPLEITFIEEIEPVKI